MSIGNFLKPTRKKILWTIFFLVLPFFVWASLGIWGGFTSERTGVKVIAPALNNFYRTVFYPLNWAKKIPHIPRIFSKCRRGICFPNSLGFTILIIFWFLVFYLSFCLIFSIISSVVNIRIEMRKKKGESPGNKKKNQSRSKSKK